VESIVEPVTIGPTWQRNPEWDGIDPLSEFVLPEHTLGWQILNWVSDNLLADEADEFGRSLPFNPTNEQKRFILWWYAVNEAGNFTFREGVLQRLKGWGKDPLAAVISVVELVGPCRFMGWTTIDRPELGLKAGDPIGKSNPRAWIQAAAVSREQTKNLMTLFPGLISKKCISEHSIEINKEIIYAYQGARRIEAVTSSPRTLEGGRPSFIVKNEALALDTPIPTPDGWTTMGDLKDGDVIYGSNGKLTIVTKAHPVQYNRRSFRVTFSEGDSVIASDGHWWRVRVANNRKCIEHEKTTVEMFESGRQYWLPDLPDRLETTEADLPVDPYIFGLWLGDGSSRAAQIACSSEDIDETLAEVSARGVRAAKIIGGRGLHIQLADTNKRRGAAGLSVQSNLRKLGVLRNKHIPNAYLRASHQQRLELLQGLMDSDGSIRPNGAARFCNTNAKLLTGVRELLLSLGYQCNDATWQRRDVEKWPERSHWQPMGFISFIAYAEVPVFRLARKAERMRRGSRPTRLRKITRIEEIQSVPVRCISIAADDKLFLAGRGMHSTRNTHHWLSSNDGHEMDAVIERNATKSKGGAARQLAITNAYEPSEDSVAQRRRESYEEQIAGTAVATGILYDSIEAPPDAKLRPPKIRLASGELVEPSEDQVREHLASILRGVRGDAVWLDVYNLANSILDKKNPPSRSRRFWFNQITASEDAWADPAAIDKAIDELVKAQREAGADTLRAGWKSVLPDEKVVMFFDGSKSDDATALVGCRVEDSYLFTIGVWQKPRGGRGDKWLVPRNEVAARVKEAFDTFNIVGFWADPSHAMDDSDSSRYWDDLIDEWHRTYKETLEVWAIRSGLNTHSVMFDLTSPERQKLFVGAAETFIEDLEAKDDVEEYAPKFKIDGHPAFVQHLRNARRYPMRFGTSLMKDNRESAHKIDLAVAAVGARLLRRSLLNTEKVVEDRSGEMWGAWA
jgi:hypothetical protein